MPTKEHLNSSTHLCCRTWRRGGACTDRGEATESEGAAAPVRPSVLAGPCSEALGVRRPAISGALAASASRNLFFFRLYRGPPSAALT